MNTTKYLIVGAGMTGDMAAKGIRDHDSEGSITMIGADPHPPYKRPLLTKGLWQGAPEDKVWREPAEAVELVSGSRIVSLDLAAGTATDDAGFRKATDAGLKYLKRLTGLQDLSLYEIPITDAGLQSLKRVRGLHEIWLTETKISDNGAAELQRELPELRIRR